MNRLQQHWLAIRSMELSIEDMSPETKAIIRKSAEQCKRDLTEKKTAEMVVNCQDVNKKMEISRKTAFWKLVSG